jgi:hypothetical protein
MPGRDDAGAAESLSSIHAHIFSQRRSDSIPAPATASSSSIEENSRSAHSSNHHRGRHGTRAAIQKGGGDTSNTSHEQIDWDAVFDTISHQQEQDQDKALSVATFQPNGEFQSTTENQNQWPASTNDWTAEPTDEASRWLARLLDQATNAEQHDLGQMTTFSNAVSGHNLSQPDWSSAAVHPRQMVVTGTNQMADSVPPPRNRRDPGEAIQWNAEPSGTWIPDSASHRHQQTGGNAPGHRMEDVDRQILEQNQGRPFNDQRKRRPSQLHLDGLRRVTSDSE